MSWDLISSRVVIKILDKRGDKGAAGIKLRQRPRTRWRLLEDMGSTLGRTHPPPPPH